VSRTSPSPRKSGGGLKTTAPSSRIMLLDVTRRGTVAGMTASASSLPFPSVSRAQAPASIIVVGGGFAGADCARALKRGDAKLKVALIEPNRTFVACPSSNEVIASLRAIDAQRFSYDRIAADSVNVIAQAAVTIDSRTRRVTLADDTS